MVKSQLRRVKLQLSRPCSSPIQPIANDGAAEPQLVGRMQPQLVGATGNRREFHFRIFTSNLQFAPTRQADFALHRIVDLMGPVIRIQPKGQLDFAAVPCNDSVQYSQVGLVDLPPLELYRQVALGGLGQRQHHQAGCVHVQAMGRGLVDAIGEQSLQPVDDAVLHFRPATRHSQQTAGLVDHYHGRILMNDFQATHEVTPHNMKPKMGWHRSAQLS